MNIGIDLGTTNSALAFIDPKSDADTPAIHVLEVPQYVAQGQLEARRTLPSFLYLGDREYIGVYARDQGAVVPTVACVKQVTRLNEHEYRIGCAFTEISESHRSLLWRYATQRALDRRQGAPESTLRGRLFLSE